MSSSSGRDVARNSRRAGVVGTTLLVLVSACGKTPFSDESEHEQLQTSQQGITCGVERWAVKTGTDSDVGSVNMSPQDSTISTLVAFPRPSTFPATRRAAPQELQVYRLTDVTLTIYKLENDSDYHLVLSDGSRTMIVEIPHPDCVGGGSRFLSGIQDSRAAFDSRFTATTTFQTANIPVTITGAGFFDLFHGQTGVAANGFELHAVLSICFGLGCAGTVPDDFSVSISPASQSAPQGGSAIYNVATAVTSGNPQTVTLQASNLPSGVNPSFNPSTVMAGSSSQLTLMVSSGASLGTTTFNVTGTGPSATHSASASLVVTPASGGPVVNGDFETGDLTGWQVTAGTVTATMTTPHGGLWAAQIGSTSPFAGDSTLAQTIAVPATGVNTLSFWYNPNCNDFITYDWQDAQIRSLAGDLLLSILHVCDTSAIWKQATADLTPFNGTSVNLVFTDHDDGYSGDPTWYLLDDVTLTTTISNPPPTTSITSPLDGSVVSGITNITAIGSAQGSATLTQLEIYVDGALLVSGTQSPLTTPWDTTLVPNGAHTLTSKAYDSGGASTTSSPVNVTVNNVSTSRELIVNGGFEGSLSGWTLGGIRHPVLSTLHPHSGASSLKCGAAAGEAEQNGDSYAWQQVTIPADATSATLSFWYYTYSTDTIQYDWQDANIRSTSSVVILNIFHICENTQTWTLRVVDLTAFRGQTIRVNFNAHGDGYTDPTALWIDDVSLMVQ